MYWDNPHPEIFDCVKPILLNLIEHWRVGGWDRQSNNKETEKVRKEIYKKLNVYRSLERKYLL